MSLMGLDVGTTGVKAVAFDVEGCILAMAYREYALSFPKPGWVELDAQVLWSRTKEVIAQVNASVSGDPVEALAVSSQGEAVAPIDERGEALNPFVVTFDDRTLPQFEWWRDHVGAQAVFRITGMPLHPMYSLNKCMWFIQNRPDLHRRTWQYLCVQDFMIHRLCGHAMVDYSLAARTMALDVKALRWSSDMLAKAQLDENLLSTVCPSGTIAGSVHKSLAAELGFEPGVKVVTGGHDQACGALGSGVIEEGMAVNSTGTVDVLCPAFDACNLDDSMLRNNYCCYPHTCPGSYISVGFNLTGGQLLKWLRDVVCTEEVRQAKVTGTDPYEVMIQNAGANPSDVLILPHFVGAGTPTLDAHSKGAIVGLTMATERSDLIRAALDCLNYEMKLNLERMADSGVVTRELRVIGGGAKSARWLQMKADVFEMPVFALSVTEAAALGAALLAGYAIGRYASLREAVDATVRVTTRYDPDPQKYQTYQSRYARYTRLHGALQSLYA